jgi:hypothetical protein
MVFPVGQKKESSSFAAPCLAAALRRGMLAGRIAENDKLGGT